MPHLLVTNMTPSQTLILIAASTLPVWATGQNDPNSLAKPEAQTWQTCSTLAGDDAARLRCFDHWAAQQSGGPATRPAQLPAVTPVTITMEAPAAHNCKNPRFSELSRFWELEAGTDCGTFGIRGYKPVSLSAVDSDSANTQPSSPSPGHSASSITPYNTHEMRIQLSVRTKIARGLLTHGQELKRDSLWFGYSQQSYWQLFSPDISRPFRATDHEPEITYIYPLDLSLPNDWRWRYAGWSLNHQSNGQALPLSRSWNRHILMAGFERGNNLRLEARWWQRVNESADEDDNPDITNLIGRAEVAGFWEVDRNNTLGMTVRHSLREKANGSVRLEWLRKITDDDGDKPTGLRFHTQLFSGYGDSLIDYNRRRTVLGLGLSLVDW